MNKKLSSSTMRLTIIGLRLVVNQFLTRASIKFTRIGDFFFNLLLYRGRTGAISFNIPVKEADGFIRQIVRGKDGRYQMEEMTYRIFNRWIVTNCRYPSPRLLMEIKTSAEINWDVKVHSVTWGVNSWSRKEACPFDTSKLPSDEEIYARHEKRRKFQDFLASFFPSRDRVPTMTIRDQARAIIIR